MPKSRQRWLGLVEAKNGTKPNDESGFVDDPLNCQHDTGHETIAVDRIVNQR